jgi:hypothetical protein
VLLLLGVIKKNDVEISKIWEDLSVHRLDWVIAAFPRDRFQILCEHICFDDIETRAERALDNP